MNDICNFIPPKNNPCNIEYYHFVYETNFKKLTQPFFRKNYYIYFVFKGEGVLKTCGKEYNLLPGTIFFTYPSQYYEIDGSDDFTFLYITFNGEGAGRLLEDFNVSADNCVYTGFGYLADFWMSSIRRINKVNANALTESVLLHSMSYIANNDYNSVKTADPFENVIEYINNNYNDSNISIMKVADMFFYSKKYLSSLFVKKTNTKFTEYINNLRIQHAKKLIGENVVSVKKLSAKCGYSDPMYFSKVFKKVTGKTPTEYIKECK